jgi:hypothetical protein
MRQRLCAAYHIERSIANRLGLPEYPCACNRCRGASIRKVETVARHHITHGRDPYLEYPVMVIPTFRMNFITTLFTLDYKVSVLLSIDLNMLYSNCSEKISNTLQEWLDMKLKKLIPSAVDVQHLK